MLGEGVLDYWVLLGALRCWWGCWTACCGGGAGVLAGMLMCWVLVGVLAGVLRCYLGGCGLVAGVLVGMLGYWRELLGCWQGC